MSQSTKKNTAITLKPCSQCCIRQHEPANQTTIRCCQIVIVNNVHIICGVAVCLTCIHAFDCAGIPRCYDHSPLALSKETEEESDEEEQSTVVIIPTESIVAGVVSTTTARASPVQLQHEAVSDGSLLV
jgi:hypothetical protein